MRRLDYKIALALVGLMLLGSGAKGAIAVDYLQRDHTTAPDQWYLVYGYAGHWIRGATLDGSGMAVPTGDPTPYLTPISEAYSTPLWVDQFSYSLQQLPFEPGTPQVADVWYHLDIAKDLERMTGYTAVKFDLTILFYDVDIVDTEIEVRVDDQGRQTVAAGEIASGTYLTWHVEAGADDLVNIELDLNGTQQTYAAAFFVDNIQFVPEPATMALMGLGGLGMFVLRRRRR